ncbi:MAG: PQQ-like beta-propeller repeat protein [Myxococcaceae bacterium]|nr:PQQ-like beta-propeller repeat protein [Myxococcaceae bacterium]
MIRFRVGQRWRREDPSGAGLDSARDNVALEVEGIDLLAGASNERLGEVVPAIVEAVGSLAAGASAAQAELGEKGFELCFQRLNEGRVELTVVALSDGPRLVRPALGIDFLELTRAIGQGANIFRRDAAAIGVRGWMELMERTASRLLALEEPPPFEVPHGFSWIGRSPGDASLRIELHDGLGRLAAYRRQGPALPCLLVPGALTLGGEVNDRPLLQLLKVLRQALADPQRSAEPLFQLGLELHVGLTQQFPALAGNPWLELLHARSRDGLAATRVTRPMSVPEQAPKGRARTEPALAAPGALRRLAFQQKWEAQAEVDEPRRLHLTRRGPIVAGVHAVRGFDTKGRHRFRHVGASGVAVGPQGQVLLASGQKLWLQRAGEKSASWFRWGDALVPSGELHVHGPLLITLSSQRTAVALNALTGREAWRLEPARTARAGLVVHGSLAFLGTESGSLFAAELTSGQLLFRIRATLPFAAGVVPAPSGVLGVLGRASECMVFHAETTGAPEGVAPGAVRWSRELRLERPSPPVWHQRSVLVAGMRDGQGVLVAMSQRGAVAWECALPLAGRKLCVAAAGRGLLVTDERGGAAMVRAPGSLDWVSGGGDGPELERVLPAQVRRGVVLVPGPKVRAIDPRSGRELAAVALDAPLIDWSVDARLNLLLLEGSGRLRSLSLGGTLAVV